MQTRTRLYDLLSSKLTSQLAQRLIIGAEMVELVDLPGLHNLHGFSEDERIARHFLETQPVNALLVVLNALRLSGGFVSAASDSELALKN